MDGENYLFQNLKYSINQKKNISLERFIYSLGIRHIGLRKCKINCQNILNHFQNFFNFLKSKNFE